jgi:branched-chain amino acid transport system substrate-binding protein
MTMVEVPPPAFRAPHPFDYLAHSAHATGATEPNMAATTKRDAFRLRSLLLVALTVALSLAKPAVAGTSCNGPVECCPAAAARGAVPLQTVQLGIVLVGLYNVNEKTGTWDADFYLHESWRATPGFAPATEIVNEIARQSEQFDDTDLRDGRCTRSRRIHSTLRSAYNLRMFPFDHQRLTLELSDAESAEGSLKYAARPSVLALDDEAKDQLSSWRLDGDLGYSRRARAFAEADTPTEYDYATFSLPVRRHVAFHVTKFFLPLFVIVAVALTVFWIDPEDLSSKAGIGVTCLLAALAFQLAEAGNLPEIAYLTLADRVYAICYTTLAGALMFAVYGNSLVRKERRDRALRFDRNCRIGFPTALLVALVLAVVRAATQSTM